MILTLEVIGEQAPALGASGRRAFNAIGGTIGRLPDNDWVFPDPYISGRHALIRYVNGKFFIEDTSTNGICINSPDTRLPKAQAHPLKHGDLLFIDAYRIRVAIQGEAESRKVPTGSARVPGESEDRTESMGIRAEEAETEWYGLSDSVAPLAVKGPVRPAAQPPVPAPSRKQEGRAESKAKPVRSGRRASDMPAASGDEHFQSLLAAAGIDGIQASREVAETLGEILRTSMEGLMEALRARERLKDEMRMRGTTFKPAHNNPLKFSANADDAFHNLLIKHNPAYLQPGAAFAEAFHDLRDHHAALTSAMRIAFESMFAQFDPERLQEEFERPSKKGSILGGPAKLRYWELYKDKYADLLKDGDAAFRALFANEFAKAYEAQLERFKMRSGSEPREP